VLRISLCKTSEYLNLSEVLRIVEIALFLLQDYFRVDEISVIED
jgi:hypothetical protein